MDRTATPRDGTRPRPLRAERMCCSTSCTARVAVVGGRGASGGFLEPEAAVEPEVAWMAGVVCVAGVAWVAEEKTAM